VVSKNYKFGVGSRHVYEIVNNNKLMDNDTLKNIKGVLLAENSNIEIKGNNFSDIHCQKCTGLIFTIKGSKMVI